MTNIIDLENERRWRVMLLADRESKAEDAQFEVAVDQIIDTMVATPLSLGEMLTAGCVAMIDLLEINGHSRADAIKTVAEKIGLFRERKAK